jgi:hypothetical protein
MHDAGLLRGKSPAAQQAIAAAMEEHSAPVELVVDGISTKIQFYSDSRLMVDMGGIEAKAVEYFLNEQVAKRADFEQLLTTLDKAASRTLDVCKYFLAFAGIDEHLFYVDKTLIWVTEAWKNCVDRRELSWMYADPFYVADRGTVITIGRLIQDTAAPFKALAFLHKAKEESDLRYKWIYTAISMELGMVEYLYAKAPALAQTWKATPSLGSMLRDHLPVYFGRKLTEAADLLTNAQIRNDLLHQPYGSGGVTIAGCIAYMDMVEKCLFTLLADLYPQSTIIRERIQKVNNDLRVEDKAG